MPNLGVPVPSYSITGFTSCYIPFSSGNFFLPSPIISYEKQGEVALVPSIKKLDRPILNDAFSESISINTPLTEQTFFVNMFPSIGHFHTMASELSGAVSEAPDPSLSIQSAPVMQQTPVEENMIIGEGLGALLLLVFLYYLYKRCRKKKKTSSDNNLPSTEDKSSNR